MAQITDEYLNFYKQLFTGNASTLAESEFATGLTYVLQGIAIEIWEIMMDLSFPQDSPAATVEESVSVCLNGETGLSTIPELDDPATIYKLQRCIRGGVATYIPLLHYYNGHPKWWQLSSPRLYAFPEMYVYQISTNSSANPAARMAMGFMFVDLGKERYYEVLQSMLQLWG